MREFESKLIRASAGTGKTFELSNRFIGLCLAGENPERILATTFTRKAAAEIRERVFHRLAEAAQDEKRARELGGHCGEPSLTSARAGQVLLSMVRAQHRLRICTLDSFFIQMAKSFSFELGFSPDWYIADSKRLDELSTRAVQRVSETEEVGGLSKLLVALARGSYTQSVEGRICRVLGELFGIYRRSEPKAWRALKFDPPLDAEVVANLANRLQDLPPFLTSKGEPHKGALKGVAKIYSQILARNYKDFLGETLVEAVYEGKKYYKIDPPTEYQSVITPLIGHAVSVLCQQLQAGTDAARGLCELVARERDTLQRTTHGYGFDDVKFALSTAALGEKLIELYFRLDGQVHHLLLDEFQDTSPSDWQVVAPIAAEILSKAGTEFTFFCVGDVKQAIYGWRGGVAEIFESLERAWPEIVCESREKSFRCSQPVIDVVNRVFTTLATNPACVDEMTGVSAWGTRYREHLTARSDLVGYTELREIAAQDGGVPLYRAVAECVREIHDQLIDRKPNGTIGILVRKNSEVQEIMYQLSRPDIALRASEEAGTVITDSGAVRAVLALFTMIDHPGDTIARFHVANTPVGVAVGFTRQSDDPAAAQCAQGLAQRLAASGYADLIRELRDQMYDRCDQRDRDRLDKLYQLAVVFDRARPVRATEFVEFIELQKVEDPSTACIRVMTVHQAKGLEFDAVVLCGSKDPFSRTTGLSHLAHYENRVDPPVAIVRPAPSELRSFHAGLDAMHLETVAEKIQEELCVLYVALTRARNALYMVIPAKGSYEPKLTIASVFRGALAPEPREDPGSVRILYRGGDPDWIESLAHSQGATEILNGEEVSGVIHLPPSPTGARRGLHRESPSARAKSARGGDDPVRCTIEYPEAAARGRIIHRLFERVQWIEDGIPSVEELRGWVSVPTVMGSIPSSISVEDLLEQWIRFMKSPEAAVLSRERYKGRGGDNLQVCREYPFAYLQGDTVVNGVIDRLVLGRHRDDVLWAEVIDFKTDSVPPQGVGSDGAGVAVKYEPQMKGYRDAMGVVYKLPEEAISSTIVLFQSGVLFSSR